MSSLCSLSVDPVLLLVCLDNSAIATKSILAKQSFRLSILGDDQVAVAQRTSAPGRPKFIDDVVVRDTEMGTPVIRGALAVVHCELYSAVAAGDHTIVIGEAGGVHFGPPTHLLIYFDRDYRGLRDRWGSVPCAGGFESGVASALT